MFSTNHNTFAEKSIKRSIRESKKKQKKSKSCIKSLSTRDSFKNIIIFQNVFDFLQILL